MREETPEGREVDGDEAEPVFEYGEIKLSGVGHFNNIVSGGFQVWIIMDTLRRASMMTFGPAMRNISDAMDEGSDVRTRTVESLNAECQPCDTSRQLSIHCKREE